MSAKKTEWVRSFSSLAGKRILITGASTGIGAAVAQALSECGAAVAVHYANSRQAAQSIIEQMRARGATAVALRADLRVPGAGHDLVQAAAKDLGGLDILINNAGHPNQRYRFEDVTPATYHELMQLNLHSAVECMKAALPHMRQAGRGCIINTTSVGLQTGGGAGLVCYVGAKGALAAISRSLAKEVAALGIRVNCVAPGYIATAIHEHISADADRDAYLAAIPLGRAGMPTDCVGSYLFLCCDTLSGYMTGQTLSVNGGMTLA